MQNNSTETRGGSSLQPDCSVTLAPDWHPLAHIDAFLLACGWTHGPEGFVPPEKWQEPIALHNGGGRHWRREHAAAFCIVYHERAGIPMSPNSVLSVTTSDPNQSK